MPNDNKNQADSSHNFPTLPAITFFPKYEPILICRIKNIWEGPIFSRWLEDVKESFRSSIAQITVLKSHILNPKLTLQRESSAFF